MKTNKYRSIALLVVGALCTLTATLAPAWDGCGHKTVAAIAHDQLSKKAKSKVDAIFKKDPRQRKFIDAAVWPDDIKQGLRNDLSIKAPLNKDWHYVDIAFDATQTEIERELINHGATVDPAHEKSANVVTAIGFYTAQLKANKGDATAKADALSWLIHLVGDIHQPLHCVTVIHSLPNYTPPSKGDLGGNGFNIHHPSHELHALWDDTFDEPTGGRHGEGRDDSDSNAKTIAAQLTAKIHPAAALLAKTDAADWAKESYALREFSYSPALDPNSHAVNPGHTITDAYLREARSKAEERVVLAGNRLAKLLESIYGN